MRYFEQTYSDFNLSNSSETDEVELKTFDYNYYLEKILADYPVKASTCDGGLYTGSLGVAYTLYKLSKSVNDKTRYIYLHQAKQYIVSNLAYFENSKSTSEFASFLLGQTGVFCIGALVHHALKETEQSKHLIVKYTNICYHITTLDYRNKKGSDELFNGRAGYLLGCLILNNEMGHKVISDDITGRVFSSIIESGRIYASKHNSPCPLMYAYHGTEYLGAGHGLSFILLTLMLCKQHLSSDPAAEDYVIRCLDYLVSLQSSNGNFAPALGERISRSNELVHWCHGGPGIIYTLARAYLRYKDSKYLDSCLLIGELTWKKGLLKKGPGICHGVAGSGYVFLTLYRLTKDARHLHRANCFAKFLSDPVFLEEARTPDNPHSLFEGLSGTCCFLSDLRLPLQSSFPLVDIFTK